MVHKEGRVTRVEQEQSILLAESAHRVPLCAVDPGRAHVHAHLTEDKKWGHNRRGIVREKLVGVLSPPLKNYTANDLIKKFHTFPR